MRMYECGGVFVHMCEGGYLCVCKSVGGICTYVKSYLCVSICAYGNSHVCPVFVRMCEGGGICAYFLH